ncbi:DUF1646 domain-containing protein [Bacillus lacus]|uniref:DUF1646 domain-containing protein n=1 Tax=Metabacillus lacus TaxID=1983721 RepID=A0A7X2J1Q9_9BACI|nr:DUF1646 family protein [Metabacillus lacus]MRX73846.1 DUF1646 domain-containing protein [Metabacillus lacus]
MVIGLSAIFLLVLFLPLISHTVEHNLELFLFVMGMLAAVFSGVMNPDLFLDAARDPVNITLAVLAAGILFKWIHMPLARFISKISSKMPFKLFTCISIVFLGLISSAITAIIAALVLVMLVSSLNLERKYMVRFVVLSCFSIGMGAALTPIGEPLSTIAISKLNGSFFLLTRLIGHEVLAALLLFGSLGAVLVKKPVKTEAMRETMEKESYEDILARALKIYFFVMGLTFLGSGFEPLIQTYFVKLQPEVLYWFNMISAVLDNATLTAAEISPVMDTVTIRAILLGLLISGGMLIPGNIPNIIAAGKLNITSKEWAAYGLPIGLLVMLIYFFMLHRI